MPPTPFYEKYGRAHYQKNKERCIERNRILQEKYKEQWHSYKASLSCAHCGASHPAIIDFHHVNPNDPDKQHVNNLIKNRRYAAAYKEIETKCIVLCANCHRIHHYEEHRNKNTPLDGTRE
jgi:hypothetical protein